MEFRIRHILVEILPFRFGIWNFLGTKHDRSLQIFHAHTGQIGLSGFGQNTLFQILWQACYTRTRSWLSIMMLSLVAVAVVFIAELTEAATGFVRNLLIQDPAFFHGVQILVTHLRLKAIFEFRMRAIQSVFVLKLDFVFKFIATRLNNSGYALRRHQLVLLNFIQSGLI